MRYYGKIFDLFLYQSIFVFFFAGLLSLLNDPVSSILFSVSVTSAIIAAFMGITGLFFNLFTKEPEEY